MCYDTYASDKKLINQIQHNTNNHTLKYFKMVSNVVYLTLFVIFDLATLRYA